MNRGRGWGGGVGGVVSGRSGRRELLLYSMTHDGHSGRQQASAPEQSVPRELRRAAAQASTIVTDE